MAEFEDQTKYSLLKLLPKGPIWPDENTPDGNPIVDLFTGLSKEFGRLKRRALDLVRESLPSTAVESLSRWAEFTGVDITGLSVSAAQTAITLRLSATPIGNLATAIDVMTNVYGESNASIEFGRMGLRMGDRIGPHAPDGHWGLQAEGWAIVMYNYGDDVDGYSTSSPGTGNLTSVTTLATSEVPFWYTVANNQYRFEIAVGTSGFFTMTATAVMGIVANDKVRVTGYIKAANPSVDRLVDITLDTAGEGVSLVLEHAIWYRFEFIATAFDIFDRIRFDVSNGAASVGATYVYNLRMQIVNEPMEATLLAALPLHATAFFRPPGDTQLLTTVGSY